MVRTSPDHTRPVQKTSHYLRRGAANSVRRASVIPALDDGCLAVPTRIETAATSKATIAPHAGGICRGRDAPSIVGPTSYTYDANGNRATETDPTATKHYTWTPYNKPLDVWKEGGSPDAQLERLCLVTRRRA